MLVLVIFDRGLFERRSQLRVINKSADDLSAKLQPVQFTNFWRSGKI
ncbi:hypothetical protein [Microcoleus sp. Pol12A5]